MLPTPEFFPGTTMNFTASVFYKRDPGAVALIEASEGSLEYRSVTWAELIQEVSELAASMQDSGVKKGDRVAAVISTSRLAVTLCLASLSIGAIWAAISPDFGAQGIIDRLVQIDPKLVFTNTRVQYNGKSRDLSPIISDWSPAIAKGASLQKLVLCEPNTQLLNRISKAVDLASFRSKGRHRKTCFEPMPFSSPGFIFYSSGTVSDCKSLK